MHKAQVQPNLINHSAVQKGNTSVIGAEQRRACYQSFSFNAVSYLLEHCQSLAIGKMDGKTREGFLKHLESLFDDLLIDYLDRDLALYRKELGLDQRINNLSADEAISLYQKYFSRFRDPNDFKNYMHRTYPELSQLFGRLSLNFTRNTDLILGRVERDFNYIKQVFLSELKEDIKLSGIQVVNSDMHKDGQQVALLEFTDARGSSIKIVYKPSPVQSDALIFGDVEKLQQFDSRYIN